MKSLELSRCPSCGANVYEGQKQCEYCKTTFVVKEATKSTPRSDCSWTCMSSCLGLCLGCCTSGCSGCTGTARAGAFVIKEITSMSLTNMETGEEVLSFDKRK